MQQSGFLRRLSLFHSALQGQYFKNFFFSHVCTFTANISAGMAEVGLAPFKCREKRINSLSHCDRMNKMT